MEYRLLGRTGIEVSALGLGCLNYGSTTDQTESLATIGAALEAGINFFDTANGYGGGSSEETLGKALRELGARNRSVVATKFHASMHHDDRNAGGTSRRAVVESCEDSLRRLNTDWIDLYQMHRPTTTTPIDETLRALDDLIRAGKVRYIGSSTLSAWRMVEAAHVAASTGTHRFVSEQPPYNLLDRTLENELIPAAISYDMALIPWSPLANGMLTGKYRRGATAPTGTRFADRGQTDHFSEGVYGCVEALESIAVSHGLPLSRLALGWCARQPGITSAIIGPRNRQQLADNVAALDVTLGAELLAQIDEVAPPGHATHSYYGPHRADWRPDGWHVPHQAEPTQI